MYYLHAFTSSKLNWLCAAHCSAYKVYSFKCLTGNFPVLCKTSNQRSFKSCTRIVLDRFKKFLKNEFWSDKVIKKLTLIRYVTAVSALDPNKKTNFHGNFTWNYASFVATVGKWKLASSLGKAHFHAHRNQPRNVSSVPTLWLNASVRNFFNFADIGSLFFEIGRHHVISSWLLLFLVDPIARISITRRNAKYLLAALQRLLPLHANIVYTVSH